MSRSYRAMTALILLVSSACSFGRAVAQITTPEQEFGYPIGADYELVTYAQLQSYWEKLARESDRMILDTIGTTEEGRPQLMAILTSPGNHGNLSRHKDIARRLALAEGISEEGARALSQEGKAVVWIDGGLHATEVLGAQQLLELVYRLASATDAETLRILDDVIVLAVHCNPDGMDLVSNWYYRSDDWGGSPQDRSYAGLPVLYHHYAGHDNNRDFYMGNLRETTNMLRVQYREWFPQIIYNHHQTGPQGTIMFAPPFRNPPNHFLDPLILTSIEQVGMAMHHRFVQEGKGGTTMRSGASYSIWWNGGLRTTPYFHNSIGLLTETRGGPNPQPIAFVPGRQLATTDLPLPVEPGVLHFRTVIEYSQTANWAVMDYASRNKDMLLFNIWRMGMNSIEKGSQDSWTVRPSDVYAASEEVGSLNAVGSEEEYRRFLRDPLKRDPRGFIIPSDQTDFPTAVRFANALMKNGVQVHQATSDFRVEARQYPAGSLVVKAAQAYRPHVLDMFEPQDHPNDFAYPGGPPIPPYDATGWTLALQMGVRFDRIHEGLDGPFAVVTDILPPPAGTVLAGPAQPRGFLLSHEVNNAFTAVFRLLTQGRTVYWLREPLTVGPLTHPAGTFYVPAEPGVAEELAPLASELGLAFMGIEEGPRGSALELSRPRIGLWDRYGGSMPSGWVRFILDEFGLEHRLVFPQELDAGDLAKEYDVLIFPDGAIPTGGRGGRGGWMAQEQEGLEQIPPEYRDRVGSVTTETTVPRLREFVEAGGIIIALEGSTALAGHFGLPVRDFLADAEGTPLRPEEFFIPGSLLEARILHGSPVTHGLRDQLIVNFARSPVFRIEGDLNTARPLAVFEDPTPLRSGWAWGQEKLQGGVAMLEAPMGKGMLYLFGPQVTYRGQTHAAYPLLFNGIFLSGAREVSLQ